MLLKSGINLTTFLKDITKCIGEVFYETNEVDSLNLKSILSQYIFAAISGNLFSHSGSNEPIHTKHVKKNMFWS